MVLQHISTKGLYLAELNQSNTWKILKNLLLKNHMPQMLEIRYVALPSSPLPSSFKPRSQVPNGHDPETIEIHRKR